MAVPVLVGIPAAISALVTWAGSMAAAFAAFVAQRGAINALAVIASLALIATFIATINGLVSQATAYLDAYTWGSLVVSITPDSLGAALTVSISADVARWVLDVGQSQVNHKFR